MLYKQPPAAPETRLIGNEKVGIIEVPVLGGLTIEEDETISELINTADDVVVLASQTAQRIALVENQGKGEEEQKLTELEAYRIIEDSVFHRELEPAAHAIAIRHAEAIAAVRAANKALETLKARATVTALLRHRLGVQDIPAGFPRVLFQGLDMLGDQERASERLPAVPMTAEALGKPPGAGSKGSKRTGARSSGS